MHDLWTYVLTFLLGLAFPTLWRLFHPWRCTGCSFTTWNASKMMEHSEAKHMHKRRTK